MINRLPADVPESGVIYDLTLTGAGLDLRKREIAMFIIDNGKFKGTRVSAYLVADLKATIIQECDVPVDQVSTRGLSARKNEIRISARIEVERMAKNPEGNYFHVADDYKDSNVYVAYHLTNFSYPNKDSEMEDALAKKDGKFIRKNDPQPPEEKPVEDDKPKKKKTATRKASTRNKPTSKK